MTPVSYVILGLLHIAHMSLYDLMKAFFPNKTFGIDEQRVSRKG